MPWSSNLLTTFNITKSTTISTGVGFGKIIHLLLEEPVDKISRKSNCNLSNCNDGNKELSVGVYIDPNKVFYTVKYRILPKNLYHYGVRGTRLNGLQIICDRKQYVEYNNSVSKLKVITCGVSQGSILAPLLFSIYIHDIAACSSLLNIVLFADDTNIFCSSKVLNKSWKFHIMQRSHLNF